MRSLFEGSTRHPLNWRRFGGEVMSPPEAHALQWTATIVSGALPRSAALADIKWRERPGPEVRDDVPEGGPFIWARTGLNLALGNWYGNCYGNW